MHHYRKNLAVLALLIAFTTAVTAVEVNTTSGLQNGSFQGTHLQDGEIRLGHGANDDALVGYWNFESKVPNKVVDASGNGNNGTLYGEEKNGELKNFDFNSESGWVSGKNGGNALRFDGSDDYVLLNNPDDFDVSEENELTISAWIKSKEVEDEPYRYIFSNSRDCCGDYGGYNLKVDNDLTAEIWDGVDQETISYNFNSYFNKWTHVTFAATGSDLKIFVNGNLVKEAKQNLSIASPSFDSHIGALSYNPSLYNFNGSIDSLRLYDRSLSSSEIFGVYNGKEDPREGLVGEWTFDSGSGSIAYDTSKWQKGIRQGKAMEFDGTDDEVKISDSSFLSPKEEFTASAWVKTNAGQNNKQIISTGVGADGNRAYRLNTGNSADTVNELDYEGSQGNWHTCRGSKSLGDGVWHHVSVVYENKEVSLYTDGEREKLCSLSAGITENDAPIYMGNDGGSRFFKGLIDNARFYSRALTSSEIRELYNPSPGYVTSGFIDAGESADWKDLNWSENLAQNTEVEGRVQTASEVKEVDEYSNWSKGTSSFSGLSEGLVGYWRFENDVSGSGGTVKDWSGNGNDGTTKNGVNTSVEGFRPLSNTYGFDGKDDHIDISSSSELTGFNQFTITTWVKTGTWHEFFEKAGQHGMRFRTSPNDFYMWTEFQSAGKVELFPSNDLPDNKWMTVAMTYNGSHLKGMIDGKVEAIKDVGSDQVVNNNNNIVLAPETGGTGYNNRFNKTIDELRVYDRALTPSELRAIHTSGSYTSDWIKADNINWAQWKQTKKGSDLEPVAQWRFDEGKGQWANDSAGDNNGKLGGGLNSNSSDPKWKNDCRYRECLEFDGSNDFVQVDDSGSEEVDVDYITMSAWVKTTGSSTGNMVMNKNTLYELAAGQEGVSLAIAGESCSSWCNGWMIRDAGSLDNRTWHYVTGTWDGEVGTVYIDGEFIKQVNPSEGGGPIQKNNNDLGIGVRNLEDGGPKAFFDGSIDDVRIYNRSLSKSSIKALYNSPSQSFSSSSIQVRSRASDPQKRSLVGSWSFEGLGQTVADSSDEGFFGTLGPNSSRGNHSPQRTSGFSGQGLKFDGVDDYVDIRFNLTRLGAPASADGDKGFSTSLWVNPDSISSTQPGHGGASFGDDEILYLSHDGDALTINMGSSDELYAYVDPGSNGGDDCSITSSSSPLSEDQWQFITTKYNGTFYLYHDKSLIGSCDPGSSETGFNSDGVDAIGSTNPSYGDYDYVNGTVDEVRIYNESLSKGDMQSLYNLSAYSPANGENYGNSLEINNTGSSYFQFKLNSITGTSKSVPKVETVTLADTSGWTEWSSSSGPSLSVGESRFVQTQFNLSSSEPERSPELSAFSILEGLEICDRRGSLNECIVDAAHSLVAEIIDVSSIFEVKDSAELTASSGTATLNITNSSSLSGTWEGRFDILTPEDKDTTIKPGASFKPENGRIVIE
jgi:hypothetical protein